jgi:hypothetical protein
MAGPISTNTPPSRRFGLWSQPAGPAIPVDAHRAAAFQSADLARDQFLRSSASLSNFHDTWNNPNANALSRGAALGDATRTLGSTLQTADQLSGQLNVALGQSKTYQAIAGSATGQAIIGTTRAAAQVVVPATNVAGSLADVATAQNMATSDFEAWQRVMADSSASAATKFVATAKVTSSASILVRKQQLAIEAIKAADENYAMNPAYQKLANSMGNQKAMQLLGYADGVMSSPAFNALQMAGMAGGMVVGAVALPKIVGTVGTNYDKLEHALYDGTATSDQKLDAIADLSRSSAATIQTVQGIRLSAVSLAQLAATTKTFGPLVESLRPTGLIADTMSTAGKVLTVLSPIADFGMLVADGVKLKHAFADPKATWGQKTRAILNVGLDGLKLGTWLMPQTLGLRLAYVGASFTQLGLVLYDMRKNVGPSMQSVTQQVGFALEHPDQAIKAAGAKIGEGMLYVSNHVYQAANDLAWGVAHPVQAVEAIGQKIAGLFTGAKQLSTVIKDSAAVVHSQAPGKTTPPATGTAPSMPAPTQPAPSPAGTTLQPIGAV